MKKNYQKKRWGYRYAYALSMLLIVFFGTSCDRQKEVPATGTQVGSSERIVRSYLVEKGALTETRTFPVVLKEGVAAKLSFRVAGKLDGFSVVPGRRFEKGDLVASLDPRDYQLIVDRAKEALKEANAALRAMETGARPEDLATAEAAYAAAKSQRETAEKQFKRMESLRQDEAVSVMQYDLAKSTYDAAVAAERAAEKTVEKSKVGAREEEIEMIKAKIAGLEIDLQLAENKLADTKLYAPFAGIVSEKFYEDHETVAPGMAVLTLVDDKSFEGEIGITEELALRLKDVEKIECQFEAIPDKKFEATIKETSTTVQKDTRAYLMTIGVNATEEDGALLGMVGTARIVFKIPSGAIYVPTSSLVVGTDESGAPSQSSTHVWIIDASSQTLSRRVVEVGDSADDRTRILSGLEGGEMIVGAGARFLSDGQKISLQEAQ